MNQSHITEVSEFCLEGRLLDFVVKDGYKLKGLLLATAEGECYVKLAKHLRVAFDWRLPRGTWLQAAGTKKYDGKTGEFKLKAESVMAARPEVEGVGRTSQLDSNTKVQSPKNKATILVCQKSDCMNRGGKAVCQALEMALRDRSLADQVTIRGTGCMKNCKAGPNVVMPDKTRYTRIQAAQIPAIIEKHITNRPENTKELPIPLANLALSS
ncbi:(2Fe-2S) ferredoxin domain-containing protein [Fortiea contorta]|uniref:(2Fe-2S) ferredoxin domain-containing protein n=1 Tax=Fortiea contorta TaxID=1892405 RepID=UPI00034DEBF3|nr:(2Fe-2S) ferredoxin domain-containing protein [Fortiea contorta]